MKLYYYSGFANITNFGDELNNYIWDKYIPGILDDNENEIFVGIGTLLNNRIPLAKRVVIMGSGVGYGELPEPKVISHWDIYCLRGKLSAAKLNVSETLVASDPAVLVNRLFKQNNNKKYKYAYMPHWMNMGSAWYKVCDELNIKLLNPLGTVENTIKDILDSEVVLTEAMHGAIVSDALRTPWIAIHSPFGDRFPFKWHDWCSSLGIAYDSFEIGRLYHPEDTNKFNPLKKVTKRILYPFRLKSVIKRLGLIIRESKPVLSKQHNLDLAIEKVENAIERFKSSCLTQIYKQ